MAESIHEQVYPWMYESGFRQSALLYPDQPHNTGLTLDGSIAKPVAEHPAKHINSLLRYKLEGMLVFVTFNRTFDYVH